MRYTVSMKQNKDFRRLYSSKNCCLRPNFVMYCRKNKLGQNRLGLTVGKKLGCAVVRNRIKRRLKELYRVNEHRLKTSYDIVIVARTKAKDSLYNFLLKDFNIAVSELNLLSDKIDDKND